MARLRGLGRTIMGAAAGQMIGRTAGRGLLGAGIGALATRLATRSVPGALLVGGGLLAKRLWDKRREAKEGDTQPPNVEQRRDRLEDADLTEHGAITEDRGRLNPIPPRPIER